MIFVRPLRPAPNLELQSAYSRLGLPPRAGEYIGDTFAPVELLLTGLAGEDVRALRNLEELGVPGESGLAPSFTPGDKPSRPGAGLLLGRRDQLDRLVSALAAHPARAELRQALLLALEPEPLPPLRLGATTLRFGERTHLMGVVNVTPDSFSDGGKFFSADAAIAHGQVLAAAGADLLDIGGESTRPGAPPVSVDEELRRIVPVLRGLRSLGVPLSVDTTKARVAEAAIAEGAALINDISGFRFDPALAGVVAAGGVACCLMHIQGTPATMQADPRYGDVVEEVATYLSDAVARAQAAGVAKEKILLDPGIGFGKTLQHNLFLLRHLHQLRALGFPLLVGPSRKAFIGTLTGGKPATERVVGTAATAAVLSVMNGADVVRVHDVAEVRDALAVSEAIRTAKEGGALFSVPARSL